MPLPYPPRVLLGGVEMDAITEEGCIEHIFTALEAGRGGTMVRPNLDHLRHCWRQEGFAQLLSSADLVVAEGMPLLWASRLQGTPLPQRVMGSDLIWNLAAAAQAAGRSIFLVGDDAQMTSQGVRLLRQRHPKIKIAGEFALPAGADLAEVLSLVALPDMPKCQGVPTAAALQVLDDLTASLCRSRPDLVFVTLDSPLQERLIHYLRHWLEQSWWVAAGNGFNFACGDGRRAPVWMRKTGLEWAHRMYRDSQDVGHRYLVDGWPQAASLLGGAAVKRLVKILRGEDKSSAGAAVEQTPAPVALARLGDAAGSCRWQARRWDGGWFTSRLFPDSPRNSCPGRRRHRPASSGRLAVARRWPTCGR